MKKTQTQKGITLVALIISIVVLLILAVVTIGSVKDSGIINHAQNAALQTDIAQIKEAFELKKSEKLLESAIDKTTNTGFALNDLDISDSLKSKYGSKLTISGGILYYTDEVSDEEEAYFEKQGISSLPQQDSEEPDPNDSEFKLALKDVIENTDKTGDSYNLITVKNAIKQEKPNSICLILFDDYNGTPTVEVTQEIYSINEKPTLLVSDQNENLEIDENGNIHPYTGKIILMKDIEAMNEFGLKKTEEAGHLEVITYKGSNSNVVMPSALYNDEGDIIYGITSIGSDAFNRSNSESGAVKDASDVSISTILPTIGVTDTSYEAMTVQQMTNALAPTYTNPGNVDMTSTDKKLKLRVLYECFLNGITIAGSNINTTASMSYGSDFVPQLFMDGMEFQEKVSDIDLTSIRISHITTKIGLRAFNNQTALTRVIMSSPAWAGMERDIFYNSSGLVGEGRGVYIEKNSTGKLTGSDIMNDVYAPWGAPLGTKFYLNGTEIGTAQ